MKKHSFLLGAFFLAIGGFLAKIIGAFYKVPLTNILGSNGMGVYYLIFPLYSLLLVLVSSGVSIAVTKMISYERANNNRKNEVTIFKVAISSVFLISLAFSLLIIIFSRQISFYQGNLNAEMGYFAIAPAIVFASLISVLRAYFQGLQNMIPTSVSNVVEQIVKLIFGLVLSNMFISKGVEFAVFGAILAVTISEFLSFLLILLNFVFYKRKLRFYHERKKTTSKTLTRNEVFVQLFRYSLPATLSSLIIPITAFLDSFMVINLIINTGQSSVVATSLYGIHNGIVNTLISFPIIFTMATSTTIVPNLSGVHSQNNNKELSQKSSFFIKLSWLFALPCFVLFLILGPDAISILFKNGLTDKVINEYVFAYKLLALASVGIIFISLLQTFTSILQSINKPSVPFISLSIALLFRVLLVYVLIKYTNLNIFGVVIANNVFLGIACLVNIIYLRRYVLLKFEFLRMFVIPIFASSVAGFMAYIIKMMLFTKMRVMFYTAIAGLVGLTIYILIVVTLKVFNRQELQMLPKIKKISRKSKKLV